MDLPVNTSRGVCLIILFISSICIAEPVSIPVKKVSGGEAHTLILTDSNNVYSCGSNSFWQLGDGTQINRFFPVEVNDGEMNTDSNFLENIIQIAAGWKHSLFLAVNHRVLAVGDNDYGELGIGNQENKPTPVYVHDGEMNTDSNYLENIVCISAGRSGEHSLAVDANHFCYAWGRNAEGQLGDNKLSGDRSLVPVKIHGLNDDANGLRNIIAVSAGEQHSMALDSNGFVYTFGDGVYGKLGINETNNTNYSVPMKVHGVNNQGYLQNIVAISAGWDHCMALEKLDANDPNCKGRVYCWGYNWDGRLGDGTSVSKPVPVIVHDGDMDTNSNCLENIIAISAGEGHSMALDANGYVWIWGYNTYGQLGNGTNDSSAVPVRVVSVDGNGFLSDINYISAGYWHNLAVDKFGRAYAWGQSTGGRLGIGPVVDDVCIPTPLYIYDVNVYNETRNKWYKRIQPAIDDACSNNVIIAYEGNYCEEIDFGTKAITLKSVNPNDWSVVDNTKIYGFLSGTAITLTSNNNCVISGLTVISGTYGISCNNSNLTINRCQIKNNSNGIYCQNADPIINHCRITNNNDGIHCLNASPTITHCTFTNNGAGIVSLNSSNPTINRCRIENNGNGVFCDEGAAATITDTFLNENSNNGIYAYAADIVVAGCNIADNTTNSYSYGIRVLGGSVADIRNNMIHHNYRGIYLESISSAEIRNNTIADNSDYGIYKNYGNDPNVVSNILWNNSSSSFSGISDANKVNYNCIQNYTGGGIGNIASNPQFRDVNDGVDDYHLAYDSNCIDKGDPDFSSSTEKDIDGEDRIMDGDSNDTFRVDIGADEFCPYDLSQDGFVNFSDFAVFAGQWGKSTSDVNDYNDRCDFYNDNVIDYKDLCIFCEYGLYPSDWEPIGGQGAYFAQDGGGEEMMMSMDTEQEFSSESIAFEIEQAVDVNSLVDWLDELWLTDKDISDSISEEDWQEFIEKVKESGE